MRSKRYRELALLLAEGLFIYMWLSPKTMQYQPSLSHSEPTTRRPITSKDDYSTQTVQPLLDMDPPIKEALPCADAHIAHYHHLLALVQTEQFFEPAGASVEAKEWLAWAHFVRWVLVGHVQPRSAMPLTLLAALPLQIVLDGRCCLSWFAALAVHVPDRRSHHEPHQSCFRRGKHSSWMRRSLHPSCLGPTVRSTTHQARCHPVAIPRPTQLRRQADLP